MLDLIAFLVLWHFFGLVGAIISFIVLEFSVRLFLKT